MFASTTNSMFWTALLLLGTADASFIGLRGDAGPSNSTGTPILPGADAEQQHRQMASCGGGNRGDGVCGNGDCCSQWGWCGTSSAHCSGGGEPSPTPPSGGGGGTCGGGSRGNGACADGSCCSQWGWCGTTSAHCSGGGGPSPTPPAGPPPTPPSGGGGGTCGGGSRGNGACADGSCCSEWGWCGTTSDHCSGGGGPSPSPPAGPSPTQPSGGGGETAYITYHNYYAGQRLTEVSCSDGTNGLITRWGYSTIDPMAPYVSAVSNVAWNSPKCGACYRLSASSTGSSIYVTAIDQCGPGPVGELHFDLHPEAFDQLLGDDGFFDGHGYAVVTEVAASNCQGNRG